MRLVDFLFNELAKYQISNVFGVTGRSALYLSDGVAKSKELNFTPLLHEQSAGFAASAYTAYSGSPSVCLVSSGVGSTNAVTPLICAWQDQLPVVFVSGQNFSSNSSASQATTKRTFGEQELDIGQIVRSSVKRFLYVDNVLSFPKNLEEALNVMTQGRPGPIWIDIPLDFQSASIKVDGSAADYLPPPRAEGGIFGDEKIPLVVAEARRPLAVLGQGLLTSLERDGIIAQLRSASIPVAFEAGAEDFFPGNEAMNVGMLGAMGCSPLAVALSAEADLIITLGTTFRSSLVGQHPGDFAPSAKILAFDFDDSEIPPSLADRTLFGGAVTEEHLVKVLSLIDSDRKWLQQAAELQRKRPRLLEANVDGVEIDLHFLANLLPECVSEEAVFVTDSGFCEVILPGNTQLGARHRWVHPFSQGSMGYCLGSVIGIANANDAAEIVTVIGDGSLMMNVQDLHTIASNNYNVKIVVVDNDMYGIIRLRQEDLFRGRTIGVDSSTGVQSIDIGSLSEGFGLKFVDLSKGPLTASALKLALAEKGPVVIKINGSRTQSYWTPEKTGMLRKGPGSDSPAIGALDQYFSECQAALARSRFFGDN